MLSRRRGVAWEAPPPKAVRPTGCSEQLFPKASCDQPQQGVSAVPVPGQCPTRTHIHVILEHLGDWSPAHSRHPLGVFRNGAFGDEVFHGPPHLRHGPADGRKLVQWDSVRGDRASLGRGSLPPPPPQPPGALKGPLVRVHSGLFCDSGWWGPLGVGGHLAPLPEALRAISFTWPSGHVCSPLRPLLPRAATSWQRMGLGSHLR